MNIRAEATVEEVRPDDIVISARHEDAAVAGGSGTRSAAPVKDSGISRLGHFNGPEAEHLGDEIDDVAVEGRRTLDPIPEFTCSRAIQDGASLS